MYQLVCHELTKDTKILQHPYMLLLFINEDTKMSGGKKAAIKCHTLVNDQSLGLYGQFSSAVCYFSGKRESWNQVLESQILYCKQIYFGLRFIYIQKKTSNTKWCMWPYLIFHSIHLFVKYYTVNISL